LFRGIRTFGETCMMRSSRAQTWDESTITLLVEIIGKHSAGGSAIAFPAPQHGTFASAVMVKAFIMVFRCLTSSAL
jgi:hypothetical protein